MNWGLQKFCWQVATLLLAVGASLCGILPFETAAGDIDRTSNVSVGTVVSSRGAVHTMAVQADGKIIVGGAFDHFNDRGSRNIARLNRDGTLDPSFAPPPGLSPEYVQTIAIQPDGRIILGGIFRTSQSRCGELHLLVRLNRDGTLDPSLCVTTTSPHSIVVAIALQPDGKILIGGYLYIVNGQTRGGVTRLNSDGTLDPSFQGSVGPSVEGTLQQPDGKFVGAITLQPDGKILIGGTFQKVNEFSRNGIARLNRDGTVDVSFLSRGSGVSSWVNAISVQRDGKIVIGGRFRTVNDIPRALIARLNRDGTLDTTFAPVVVGGTNSEVKALLVQPDGRIVIGGALGTINAQRRDSLARVNSDGTLDAAFRAYASHDELQVWPLALAAQPAGKIIIAGDSSTYRFDGASPRGNPQRLNSDGTPDTTFHTAGPRISIPE
ncbi:MAG: delta-60 repeat domain-containing protein [Acidobacteria bacterium]|nr:delta-60 repeat domain-containing protein [Acidobacteriota bacterium]